MEGIPIKPVDPLSGEDHNKASTASNATSATIVTATSTSRALMLQLTHLYLRTPAKLFRPPRWDYLTPTRVLLEAELRNKPWNVFTHSSLALIYRSVKKKGLTWVGEQVGPPLVANALVGAVLYGTYLLSLNSYAAHRKQLYERHLQEEQELDPDSLLVYPTTVLNAIVRTSVTTWDTFKAGFLAGAVSSIVASPLDALYSRSTYAELISGKQAKEGNMFRYAWKKLGQVGLTGVFAGFWLNFLKESVGFGCYFAVFESVKNYGYYVAKGVFDGVGRITDNGRELLGMEVASDPLEVTKGERILRLTFVLIAGASAGYTLMGIQYPINKVQKVHLARLEALDIYNEAIRAETSRWFKIYYHSYKQTWDVIRERQMASGVPWSRFMYKGFHKFALANVPATSIGLLVFEIGRERVTQGIDEEWLKP